VFVRNNGTSGPEAKITLADLAYDIDRLILYERRTAMG
jgi:hypothetical protein